MRHTKLLCALLCLSLSALTVSAQQDRFKPLSRKGFGQYVNPLIGTTPLTDPRIVGFVTPDDWRPWSGLTYPGSSLPNAMVQLSPITAWGSGAGYQYEDSTIIGFAHTNKGHWNLCNVPILPVSGNHSINDRFSSRFSHKTEAASPGYYQVYLDDYGVDVRLTSTLRAGYHQYLFRNADKRQVLLDLGRANNGVRKWTLTKTGPSSLEGFQDVGNDKIHLYITLNSTIEDIETLKDGERDGRALITLKDDGNKLVELKIGLSFASIAGARQNLEMELGQRSFEAILKSAQQTWEALLSRVDVSGGTAKQREMFYTCLYRSFLWPTLRSDLNGEYRDVKRQVVKGTHNYYEIPSLWDTYRNNVVLQAMLSPAMTSDVIKSMKDMGDKTGFIPTFFHGDHGLSYIAGSYLRGIDNFDVEGTYKIMLRNAYDTGRGGRPRLKGYMEQGYVAEPVVADPQVETVAAAGVSKTLEYAYDDYALAQMAQKLGDTANYRKLMARAANYKNVFDPSSRFMRGRLADGNWVTPFNPDFPYYEYMYREANAWQLSFYVPHDPKGLVALYGEKNYEAKLDSLFTYPWNPKHIARNVETMVGQYCHGNQPDHEAPFAYYFINKPEKSQKMVDYILDSLYGMGAQGLDLSGMDDAGEMSSWYVFSALGLYPYSAVDPQYLVSVPVFSRIKWTMPNGRVVEVRRNGNTRSLGAVSIDGKTSEGYFIPHDLFRKGGKLVIQTK
ncbi:MAG: glycoside hydrolase family 92 protein [Chitinophagaceae bacterium]|nr:MAG: glycoside hydrolase family 92 protein [Chitinophagaceae bacterium]